MALPGEEDMEEDIWTVRKRRRLGPCRTSQRTWRAWRSGGIFQLRWSQCPVGAKGVLPAPGSPSGLVPARGSGPAPGTGGESVCGETHQPCKGPWRSCRKVHHPRWELGGSAKDAALGEEDIIRLAQDQEETKVNLLELQGQVLWLVSDHNEGHDKFLTTAQSPADEPALGPPIPQELGSADKQGDLWEVSLTDSVEPAPGEAREGSPHDSPTAQHIVQLLPLTQDSPGAPRFGQQPLHAILLTVLRSGR
ncbi:golgin subfamily A member 2-like isoform X3 [Piliocolobus tephrosceles]|uniref:golgin subfamily A member 2-like isoform X3 n=1 Tax=Piliocolobus tephrosceles TaxID=591936 RepID=UPI000E6B2961|nr:golgin subfamily A member 2-like isoform X3 [Piliocolobus tephrosceles]